MAELTIYMDACAWGMWFIVGAVSAWPHEESDPRWQVFGYGILALVVTRCILYLLA